MSKKKNRSKVEKATVRHNFTHLENSKVFQVKSDKVPNDIAVDKKQDISPQNAFVAKDLKLTTILIVSFIFGIIVLGFIFYKTGLFVPLFNKFGLKY